MIAILSLVALGWTSTAEPLSPALPRMFVENRGQFDARARFAAVGSDMEVFAVSDGLALTLHSRDEGSSGAVGLWLCFEGLGEDTEVVGIERQGARYHYFLGADPAAWRVDVPGYAWVRHRDAAAGIEIDTGVRDGAFVYDVRLAAGADPARVVIRCDGALGLDVADDGSLLVETAVGTLRQTPPAVFAIGNDGASRRIVGRFRVLDRQRYGFEVASCAGDGILIDPGLVWSTLLGGPLDDVVSDVAMDAAGRPVVCGRTRSPTFPVTAGAFDTTYNSVNGSDAYVARFDAQGAALQFAAFLGGSEDDYVVGMELDDAGVIYLGGSTQSGNFPVTVGALDTVIGSPFVQDAFHVRLAADGSSLLYGTYIGGSGADVPNALARDSQGRVYIAGHTFSADFPVTAGAFDTSFSATRDGFIACLDASGTSLAYATFLGAANGPNGAEETVADIAVNAAGAAYACGYTDAANFPVTAGAVDPVFSGPNDAFVLKLRPDGSGLVFSTFLGGSDVLLLEHAFGIALHPSGACTVVGITHSADFPTTPGALATTLSGPRDAFVSTLDSTGSSLLYSTLLGGDDYDFGYSVSLDAAGRRAVSGVTRSSTFPTTAGAVSSTNAGVYDGFFTLFSPSGTTLEYSTLLGTPAEDVLTGHVLTIERDVILVGGAGTAGLPTTAGAFDTTGNGGLDGFVTRLALCPGSFAALGGGCAGTGGVTPTLAASGCPSFGSKVELSLAGGLGNSFALLLFGLGTGAVPIHPSCSLSIAPLVPGLVALLPLDGAGAFSSMANMPAGTPSATIFLQAVIMDPGAPGGAAASNALQVILNG